MKIIDIALKDEIRFLRNFFSLAMAVAIPLAMTAIFYLAFGQPKKNDINLPVTRVQLADMDTASTARSNFDFGKTLTDVLASETLAKFIKLDRAPDEATARAAVDTRQADVAIIIPAGFTAQAFDATAKAAITLYQDPTLILGPGIVRGTLKAFIDSFIGSKIAYQVSAAALQKRQLDPDGSRALQVSRGYTSWVISQSQTLQKGTLAGLEVMAPPGKTQSGQTASIISQVMVGMMIFFAFFTAAGGAETLIREDEEGTLARLFTTPTPHTVILGGKLIAVFAIVLTQVVVLLVAAGLIFQIDWGQPLSVALASIGLVIAASGFGVFIMSLVKSTRQAGPVMGGVLTIMGMLGGLFTSGFQNLPASYNTLNLLTPHGWAFKGWKIALAGGTPAEMLLPFAMMLAFGIVTFVIGVLAFRKRFA